MNQETQKIDIIMYRITNQRYTDTTIAAVQRGVPVRLIHEPEEYRNPARHWDSWNVDRMYMAGVQIKMRKHLGLNHQKSVLLYGKGMTIFGSSNWTGPSSNSQAEHNYFTTKPWFFQWFVDQLERKWNNGTGIEETAPFVPLPPGTPAYVSPANGATNQSTTITLQWDAGLFSHVYDIYLGTTPESLVLVAADVVEIHPHDAEVRGIRDGDLVGLTSRSGEIVLPAEVTARVRPGVVYTTFHFPELNLNTLLSSSADDLSKCPEYKVSTVAVSRASAPRGNGKGNGHGRSRAAARPAPKARIIE